MWHLPLRIFLEVVEVSTKPGEVQTARVLFLRIQRGLSALRCVVRLSMVSPHDLGNDKSDSGDLL
jgi:hypothetical protein